VLPGDRWLDEHRRLAVLRGRGPGLDFKLPTGQLPKRGLYLAEAFPVGGGTVLEAEDLRSHGCAVAQVGRLGKGRDGETPGKREPAVVGQDNTAPHDQPYDLVEREHPAIRVNV
jgi:hypothetical protein